MLQISANILERSNQSNLFERPSLQRRYRTVCFVIGTLIALCFSTLEVAVALDSQTFAKQFRAKWPWHIQTITYAFADDDGGVHFLVSEPPNFISPRAERLADLASVFGGKADVEWIKTRRGMNGWVQDLAISTTFPECKKQSSEDCEERLEEAIADLSSQVFGTAYKAHAVKLADVPKFDAFSAPKDLQIDVGGFSSLFETQGRLSFLTWNGEAKGNFRDLIDSDSDGTFYSTPPGLVAFAFSSEQSLKSLRGAFRQFALDSDVLLGGVAANRESGRIVLLGRERETGLFQAPPLRFEDLELAVRLRDTGQFQTFGTALFQGGRVCHGKYPGYDFFPAFLSKGLIDTRYGSTLNSADVLIKNYTRAGGFKAPGLDLPLPKHFPFKAAEVIIASGGRLVYNWSLDRGVQILEAQQARFVMSDHSNALSVSYFGESGPDLSKYEVKSQNYFLKLRSLPVFEARQLTTLLAVLQNRVPRSALEDATTANRTLQAAEALVRAAYETLAQKSQIQHYIDSSMARYLKDFSEQDKEFLEAIGESSSKAGALRAAKMASQSFSEALNDIAKVSTFSRKKILGALSEWQMERTKNVKSRPIRFSDFLKKENRTSFNFIQNLLIDYAAEEVASGVISLCLVGDIEAAMAGIDPNATGNIKTTDYVLSKLLVTTHGGHNLHREELVFRPSTSSNVTVRRDPDSGRYIVDVPRNLVGKLDMPKVLSELKRRDLRGTTKPQTLSAPQRRPPEITSLTARTSKSDVHIGASAAHVPARSLFSGFGWKSEVGRLTQREFRRQLQIAESRGYDLIVKSIGGDFVIYRKVPPGQFLVASNKAFLETLSEWTTSKSKIYFQNVPKGKVEAILESIPLKPSNRLETLEMTPMAGGGGSGNIVSRGISVSPSDRYPLRIITYSKNRQSLRGRLLSAFLGRRPDWSKATVEQVKSSADNATFEVRGETYYELGWKVSLPEGRGEASYFKKTGTQLKDLSSLLVKAFSKDKWTKASDIVGNRSIREILKRFGTEFRNNGSKTAEDFVATVRDEMRSSLKAGEVGSREVEIRILTKELEATYEFGAIELTDNRRPG